MADRKKKKGRWKYEKSYEKCKTLSFIGHPMEKYCAKKHEQDLKLVSAIFYQFFIFCTK